jgi:hypothetical protein
MEIFEKLRVLKWIAVEIKTSQGSQMEVFQKCEQTIACVGQIAMKAIDIIRGKSKLGSL